MNMIQYIKLYNKHYDGGETVVSPFPTTPRAMDENNKWEAWTTRDHIKMITDMCNGSKVYNKLNLYYIWLQWNLSVS